MTPVDPEPELDPFFDAVGRLVTSCQILEVWLYHAISELVPGFTMFDAEKKLRPQGCIQRLREIAPLLPETDRGELLQAMDDAEEVFETRHQVVHGVHGPTVTPGVRIALRASMSQRDADGNPVTLRGRLTRERMLQDRDRAIDSGGLLQVSASRWAEELGLDRDDD
jgi:hypothetical protein